METKVGLITDKGKKRKINEDSLLAEKKYHLYVVADGMGGHHGAFWRRETEEAVPGIGCWLACSRSLGID